MNQLVSVIVITYNSSNYILETLESIKAQTYQNIELIISDDGSKDETIGICEKWITENKNRFANTHIITVEKNTGIPANCNRGIRASKGEWIKLIAGDDLLLNNCIEVFCENTGTGKVLVGSYQLFSYKSGQKILGEIRPSKPELRLFDLEADEQYKKLLTENFNFAPATFIKKEVFQEYGLFLEQYTLIEDLPYWLHITKKGQKIAYIDEVVVEYRTMHESISMTVDSFYRTNFMDVLLRFRKEMIYPNISRWNLLYFQKEFVDRMAYIIIKKIFNNKRNTLTTTIRSIFTYLTLQLYVNHFNKKFNGKP